MKRGILFDMDGVLVEVSNSYRMTIKKTVAHYLGEDIPADLIQQFKDRGGLNNDWDLTESILNHYNIAIPKNELIDRFQKIYLGKNFDGLISNETWLLEKKIIRKIRHHHPIGIVTGRPRMEAEYVLQRFGVKTYFPVMITMDDLPADKQKPHPAGIRMAMEELGITESYYLGDTVDDMIAASAAHAIPVGVLTGALNPVDQKKLFDQHGAQKIIKGVNDILEVVT